MDKETVISVENVSKKYCKSLKKSMYYGAMDIGRNVFGMSSKSSKLRNDEFWALNDISFEVKKGETFGIIGPNGSGKTTLLKLLNGIFWPDKGKITIKGRVVALIELGAGFHPLLTGRENIYINSAILGMTKNEVSKKFDEIVDFSGIGDFLDTPVKYYSSGMLVKLGFSVAIHSEPNILLIDEALAVGDIQFQVKCFRKMWEFKETGKTILLVTHDMGAIQKHTEKVILLKLGKLYSIDSPKNTVNRYLSLMSSPMQEKPGSSLSTPYSAGNLESINKDKSPQIIVDEDLCRLRKNYNTNEFRYGNGAARIVDFELKNMEGQEITHVQSMGVILFCCKVRFYKYVENPILGVVVKTKEGVELYGTNTLYGNVDLQPKNQGDEFWVEYKMNFSLQPGDYFISAGITEMNDRNLLPLDRRYDLAMLSVLPGDKSFGIVNMNAEIKIYEENELKRK